MKLTGALKEKAGKTVSKEEAKEVIAEAGMELTDEELGMVAGGDTRDEDLTQIIIGSIG